MSLQTATAAENRDGVLATAGHSARVNLLPPEIYEARRLKKVQAVLALAVAATLAAAGGTYHLATERVATAEEQLAVSQAETSRLKTEEAKYAEVPRVLAEVDAAKAAQAMAMATDVEWYRYLNALSLTTPDGVWLKTINATVAGPGATAGTAPVPVAGANPLGTPGIGAVTFTGQAENYDDVAAWIEAMGQQPGWADAYVNSSTTTEIGETDVVDFTGKVVVTEGALSKRFEQGVQ